jgi:hypothetical protein
MESNVLKVSGNGIPFLSACQYGAGFKVQGYKNSLQWLYGPQELAPVISISGVDEQRRAVRT